MPFTCNVGVIAGFSKGRAPKRSEVYIPLRTKRAEPGIQHRSTCNANGRGPTPLLEAMGERAATSRQAIDVRCVDFRIGQRMDSPVRQIVRDNKKKVLARINGRFSLGCFWNNQ